MRNKTYILITKNMEGTFDLGFKLGGILKGVVCLEGDLGSGKTVMAKGIAKRLGITDYITSPTFNIISSYDNDDAEFYHMDAYRIEGNDMLYDIGFDDILYPDGITLIEWADKIKNEIPDYALWIKIHKADDMDTRIISLTGNEELINKLGSEYINDPGN